MSVRATQKLLDEGKFPDVLRYLTETRGLSREVLHRYGVGAGRCDCMNDANIRVMLDCDAYVCM